VAEDTLPEAIETLAAWRERGDDRFDPVRFRFIEAMARRAAAYDGEARRMLDERVAQLLAAYGDALGQRGDARRPSTRGMRPPCRGRVRPPCRARHPLCAARSPS
jgi:hypothetical protein